MCGIGLILSGFHVVPFTSTHDSFYNGDSLFCKPETGKGEIFTLSDLKSALIRRGPDSFGIKCVSLGYNGINLGRKKDCETVDCEEDSSGLDNGNRLSFPGFQLLGAELQLRGMNMIHQPLVDSAGNHLAYNGEIFGGLDVDANSSDAEALLSALANCCSCEGHVHRPNCNGSQLSVPQLLSSIRGPWTFIYWQASSRTIWFGRDALGRRSLLVHWPTSDDCRFVLSSVSPPDIRQVSDSKKNGEMLCFDYWDELCCGIYSVCLNDVDVCSRCSSSFVCEVKKHGWEDDLLNKLINWERGCDVLRSSAQGPECFLSKQKNHQDLSGLLNYNSYSFPRNESIGCTSTIPAVQLLVVLKESIKRRVILSPFIQSQTFQKEDCAPIAVLFSGGLDSMILAALLDQCLNSHYEIDLLNVSFDGELAPDRISSRAGLRELKKIAPSRKWHLVQIDADLSNMAKETKHVMSLIKPANTYMDLNIGLAIWLAARGDGWVDEYSVGGASRLVRCQSKAKVVLVGTGADEQCAGYSRYRTKYREGSWTALEEEMKLDMQRIWKRNLGRDDRCISDLGKEARFPFLDEEVVQLLLAIPLKEIADLNLPVGKGDKKILREVARLLSLEAAAALPKRAIQFGSRIAKESNKRNFGSNHAANQVSAGSMSIPLM